jgi:hypothetical protein
MGSLLAVPGWVSEDSLGLKTLEARMVFRALQNYGGYITDKGITAPGSLVTQVDPQAVADIPDVTAFNADLRRIFRALQVVANSHDKGAKPPWGPGGGGTPPVPLAPPLSLLGNGQGIAVAQTRLTPNALNVATPFVAWVFITLLPISRLRRRGGDA